MSRTELGQIMEKEKARGGEAGKPANDNGTDSGAPLDPRIVRIAEAIGRQLAREHANDNAPRHR
jgi:hypothetical protein